MSEVIALKARSKRATGLVTFALAVVTVMLLAAGSATAATYEKTPGGTNAQIANSVFFVAVNTGADGTGDRVYYYFSLDELKNDYGVETRAFTYNNHGVMTTTIAHGFSMTKLLDSLVDIYHDPLNLPDTSSIQYLEADAYHADTAVDTIAAARDTTKSMLAYEVENTYATPTKYNVNDTMFKWAETTYPEFLRAYRDTGQAGDAILKFMTGIVVSPDGKAYDANAGAFNVTGTDGTGNQVVVDSSGNTGRIVKGVLAGMKFGVHAPLVPASTPAQASQVVRVDAAPVAPATVTQTVNFDYVQASNFLVAKSWTTGVTTAYTQNQVATDANDVQIPDGLATVQGLVAGGDAASLVDASIDATTADFTMALPTRLLFVDTRASAGSPNPYGFTDLNLYRYFGKAACAFASVDPATVTNVVVTSSTGAKTLYTGVNAGRCFIAYKDTQSKACPNNTAESKRFAVTYNNPELVSSYDGSVLVSSVAKLDVNAPLVASLKITASGRSSVTVKRAKSIWLTCATKPKLTVEKITWRSSNSKIASVSSKGKVTASTGRTGTVTITATATFGKTATFKVKVVR
jgi:hypothetical protein